VNLLIQLFNTIARLLSIRRGLNNIDFYSNYKSPTAVDLATEHVAYARTYP